MLYVVTIRKVTYYDVEIETENEEEVESLALEKFEYMTNEQLIQCEIDGEYDVSEINEA